MTEQPIKILLVDDHTILRIGLRLLLQKLPGIRTVSEAGSCSAALEQIAAETPDLIIMDAHLPGIDGIEGTRRILAQHPGLKIMMLSADCKAGLVWDALRAGALAYVSKENSQAEITSAIDSVMAGEAYLSPKVTAVLARYCRENAHLPFSGAAKSLMTEAEKRLLRLVAQGKRNKEIAGILKVTTNSVEAYRSRLMSKLNCASPAELTRYAIRQGLVEP